MKVTLKTGDRMELRGIPQGRGLVFGFLICTGIAIVAGIFAYMGWVRGKSFWAGVGPAVGVVMMLFMMLALVLLSFQRERLVLDKVTKTVEHETWSLLIGTRKSKVYPFDKIAGVAVQRSLESPGGGRGFPIEVTKARLLISRPRRAIDLDEVQRGSVVPVEALALEVAEFLDKPLKALGSHEEPERRPKERRKRDPGGVANSGSPPES